MTSLGDSELSIPFDVRYWSAGLPGDTGRLTAPEYYLDNRSVWSDLEERS